MIRYTTGNLLVSGADALVNAVNTVGVSGKRIALTFRQAYPANFKAYEAAAKAGRVVVGEMFITERQHVPGPRFIVNFPTKQHWRHPSRLEWIDQGLAPFAGRSRRAASGRSPSRCSAPETAASPGRRSVR
jgi:O-acetyl-ADP-ribose deacetylase (regulator of RNase III)